MVCGEIYLCLQFEVSEFPTFIKNYNVRLYPVSSRAPLSPIRVAYNDCYRMLHNLPRYTSTREFQVINHIPTFEALLRKTLYNFINCCLNFSNLLVTNMMNTLLLF